MAEVVTGVGATEVVARGEVEKVVAGMAEVVTVVGAREVVEKGEVAMEAVEAAGEPTKSRG
jgi:hypothetical protein